MNKGLKKKNMITKEDIGHVIGPETHVKDVGRHLLRRFFLEEMETPVYTRDKAGNKNKAYGYKLQRVLH